MIFFSFSWSRLPYELVKKAIILKAMQNHQINRDFHFGEVRQINYNKFYMKSMNVFRQEKKLLSDYSET